MYRDPSEFRERFKAYKDGKSVREIYGLPGYAGGKFDATTKKKIDYYYKLLRNNGFDMMSAIGILGNMMQESSFDPDVVNHLGYHGLLLNSKAIQNAIKNLYGDLSEQSQLRYLSDWTDGATWIRKGPYASDTALYSKSYLRSGYKTPELAAYEFLKRYERAIVVDPNTKKALRDANGNYVYLDKDKRLGYAKSIYNYLSGRPDGIQDLIALVGATQPEPIIAMPDATRVSTIPTVQQQAIDYSDRINTVAAEAERAIWAHNVMEDMKGAYQVPIWESPSLPALTPVEYDTTPLKTYAGGKIAEEDEPVIRQGTKGSRLDRFSRMMDPDEDDGTVTRVIKKVGKYANNGYFKDIMQNILNGLQAQKKFIGKLKNGKLPGYKDGIKMQWDADAGIWRRVMDDPYADVFNNLVITPKYIRPKFEYETNPNYQQSNKNEVVKPDETLLTRQQVEKANNTRTWRSDAADAMKYVQYASDAAGLLYGMTPGIKQRAAKAIYRNIVPASYKDSYLPGGKKQEVVNAIKDFFTPKKLDIDNSAYRKWEQENLSLFFTDTDPVAARDEIYRKYLGLPNDDFYYIKNADGTYSHNLTNHEPHDIVTIINNTYNNDRGLSGKNQVLPDMLNSAGGWVNTSLKKANDIQARFKYNDVWDVNPFQDADRVGNVFPKKLLNKYSHIEKLADGEEVRVWNKDVPWFIKKLQNFELSDLTNGAPVPVKTDINVRLLNPEEYSYTKKLTDAQIINKMKELDLSDAYDLYGDAMSDGIISEADWNEIELRVADKVYDTFYKDPNKYRKMFVYNVNHPLKKLFDWYGPFVLLHGYKDGKIAIKPSKRGTFTAAAKKHGASVREFESRVLKNPEKYSKAMVKKARFSRNARSWKH